MLPLLPGDLCPRCRRIVPEAGQSRPIDAPLTEPIDVRALELLSTRTPSATGLPAAVRRALRDEFGASEELLLRTTHRVQHWLASEAHARYRREG